MGLIIKECRITNAIEILIISIVSVLVIFPISINLETFKDIFENF